MQSNNDPKYPGTTQARFDQAAATWDENPARLLLATQIASAIRSQVPVDPGMTIIDFGCGTGLVSLALQPYVGRIIGIDSSPGMLAVLNKKEQQLGITNVETLCWDLNNQPTPDLHADIIVSAMTLHHIPDLPKVLRALLQMLTPGGYLALADLEAEDGTFHEDSTGVYHHGIDRDWLLAQLQQLGLRHLNASTAHVIERPSAEGLKQYPVFLISGQKP